MSSCAALPTNYLWTWDHSTNWVLDDPGLQTWGCYNPYTKRPETYVEDYRRLTDMCVESGFGGILIWGFLRDSHGGVAAAQEVASYAASQGVRILPGLGTTDFGGAYYEGRHEFNLETFLERHPECAMIEKDGTPARQRLCPTHPKAIDWVKRGAEWLMETFEIGGVNLENGDFLTCYCPRCRERYMELADAVEYYKGQLDGYGPSLEALGPYLKDKWITYATYSGFNPTALHGDAPLGADTAGGGVPTFVDVFPDEAIGQWTLTCMVRPQPLPLTNYLDCGVPEEVYDNPRWPRGIKVPTRRGVGFLHQASQWGDTRYRQMVSCVKEACLRAPESGLEGVVIHGELTDRYTPWWLNYQALVHFSQRPQDTLRDFARERLAPELGGEDEAQTFIEALALWDAGEDVSAITQDAHRYSNKHSASPTRETCRRAQRWIWLCYLLVRRDCQWTPGFF